MKTRTYIGILFSMSLMEVTNSLSFTVPPWGRWGACSLSCGHGRRGRVRTCTSPPEAPSMCNGVSLYSYQSCNTHDCPTSSSRNSWNPWGSWSYCSKSMCGNFPVLQRRVRTCSGGSCPGLNHQERTCPFCQAWSPWGSWSYCSNSLCSSRPMQRRDRTCSGGSCPGLNHQDRTCPFCQTWSPWGSWSRCSLPCGGERKRTRTCSGGGCPGSNYQHLDCSTCQSTSSSRRLVTFAYIYF